jgi:heme/copper-type cytochrome/quinol oxidase subunit 1
MSLLLFFAGGGIALLIEEVDVTIPAHYHGSIVGISLAYMGLAYAILPRLGGRVVEGRAAFWQPVVYGMGQLLHITGLLISGGYDVARKTTESYDGVTGAQIGMGLMGLGGLVAIIGGLMFVVIIWRHRHPATA